MKFIITGDALATEPIEVEADDRLSAIAKIGLTVWTETEWTEYREAVPLGWPAASEQEQSELVYTFTKPSPRVLSSPSQDDWLAKSAELYRSGKREESLDIIFDSIDDMLLESKFEDCDKILAEISVAELANPQLLTVLTATAPAKERLPSRQALVKRVKLTLNERGGNASRLLAGLE